MNTELIQRVLDHAEVNVAAITLDSFYDDIDDDDGSHWECSCGEFTGTGSTPAAAMADCGRQIVEANDGM